MGNDLLITINADAKNVQKAFDDVRDQTQDLENTLKNVALVSGAAFAAFTVEILSAVKSFEEARQSSVQLSTALQNQGIFTEELKAKYQAYAEAVEAATGIDNDAVTKSQAIAQSYLGQTQVTEELTFAIADLAQTMGGDLNASAEKIARTIGTGVNAFARQGLVISQSATEAERYAQVLEFVQLKAGGLGEEFNKADGYSKALGTSFGNLQKAIGADFAPIIEAARKTLIGLFDTFSKNPLLSDLAAAALAAGAAVSGLVLAVSIGVPAFLALSAAASTFGVSLGVALGGIPLLIGAVVGAVTLLALNWDKSMAAMAAAARSAVVLISELFAGLGQVLSGAFNLNPEKIKQGLDQIVNSFKKAKDDAIDTYHEITASQQTEGEKQNAQKAALAAKEAAEEAQHQANLRAIRKAEIDLLQLENEHASADLIALKTKEIETLKALDSKDNKDKLAQLNERMAEINALQDEQNAEDIQRQVTFQQLQADTKDQFDAQRIQLDAQIRADRLAQIQATANTEQDTDRNLQESILAKRIATNNQLLLEKKKYGDAYAKLNKAVNSDELNETKAAADGLVALAQSTNSTLKGIGKAAAITQIGIDTARGAMAVYANFQTAIPYPPVSIPLGLAAAAAMVAYGAERIGQVTSAARGGLIEGGIPGVDSVPALLTPGELVVPSKNFDQVVGAVQGQGSDANNAAMISLLQSIDAKFSSPQTNIINGDVLTDDSFVNALVKKISDAIEFGNARIVGVNI